MSILNVDFDSAVEPTNAPAGRYLLQVTACEEGKTSDRSKNPGQPQLKVSIGFPDHLEYQGFTHYVGFPAPGDEPKSANWKVLNFKRLLRLFNVHVQSGDIDLNDISMQLVGATAQAEVGLTAPNDDGRVFNTLKLPPAYD